MIEPGEQGKNGMICVLYGEMYPCQGINDKGLFFDLFATPRLAQLKPISKEKYKGQILFKILQECASVDEALAMLDKYDLEEFFYYKQMMIADKNGDSAIIEGDIIHRKNNSYQVVTNFHLSDPEPCERYKIVNELINNTDISVSSFENILNSVKVYEIEYLEATLFSYIIDQSSGELNLYLAGDFSNRVTLNIKDELEKGYRIVELALLFNPNKRYNDFVKSYLSNKKEIINQGSYTYYDLTGSYKYPDNSDASGFIKKILVESDRLYIRDKGIKYELFPCYENIFFAKEMDLYFIFTKDENGIFSNLRTIHQYWPWDYVAKLIPGSKYDDYYDDDYIYSKYKYDDLN